LYLLKAMKTGHPVDWMNYLERMEKYANLYHPDIARGVRADLKKVVDRLVEAIDKPLAPVAPKQTETTKPPVEPPKTTNLRITGETPESASKANDVSEHDKILSADKEATRLVDAAKAETDPAKIRDIIKAIEGLDNEDAQDAALKHLAL